MAELGRCAVTAALASLAVLVVAAAALTARRLAARRSRAVVRIRLVPGRTDEATPAEVERLLEVLHQLVLRRWWQRLLHGQPSLALELWGRPGEAGTEARLAVVLPDEAPLVQAVRGRLLATYRDVLLQPWDEQPVPCPALVRLKKREPFITRLRTPEDYTAPLVDAVLAALAELAEPVLVQLALTPTPALFDRVSRWRFRATEQARERARLREGGDPGLRSEVVGAELAGGLHVQHRPLFFCDLRVAAATLEGARLVARALRGESAQENRLVERTVRLRAGLYRPRLEAGRGNPLPGLRRGVLSSSELTGLWHLPSPFLDVVRVARNPVPRVPAPPSVRRTEDPERALGRDAHGLVCLHDTDKYANLALLGRPGGGKTSVMLRSALTDARDRECALIILDPKGELADAALGHLPADGKPVHVISLGDGEAGIDPFHVPGGTPQTVAAGIVAGMKAITEDAQGAHQIGFSSDRYLRQAAIAIAAAEEHPDMWKLWRLVNASEAAYRRLIAERLRGLEGLEQTQLFLAQELPYQLEKSPANFITRLDAPQNKAIRTTTGALDVCFRHPYRIDIDGLIARREVLIVNGCAGEVETDDVAVVMQFALVFIHNALLRQQRLPKNKRARVALKVDEAHLGIFSHKFAELLALGRSSGLECVCAFQSPSQIPDPALRARIFDLLQHWCVFASGEDCARELSALLQTVYADVQRDDSAARDRQRISTDALINLPRYWFAASWLAHGARVNPFVAQTLPMGEPDPELARLHVERQRARGAHRLSAAQLPVAYRSVGKETDDGLADEPAPNGNGAAPPGPEGAPGRPAPASRPARAPVEPPASERPAAEPPGAKPADASPAGPAEPDPSPSPSQPYRAEPATEPPREAQPPAPGTRKPLPPEAALAQPAHAPKPEERPTPEPAAAPASSPPRETQAAQPRPKRESRVDRPRQLTLGSEIASLSELDLYARPRQLKWDAIERAAKDKQRPPTVREQAIMAALVELKLLASPQIARRFMPDASERTVRNQLHAMCTQGWLRRAHLLCEGPGQTPRVFALDDLGWAQIKDAHTRFRPFVVSRRDWRRPELSDERRIPHDLHANAWYFAFERLAGHVVGALRGPHSARLYPPSKPHPDYRHDASRRLALTPDEIADRCLGSGQRLDGIEPHAVAPIHPDLAIEVSLPKLPRRPRQHYLLELEHSRHPAGLKDKLARYDSLITGWARTQEPFLSGLPPAVIFVFPDERMALAVAKLADALVRGRIASLEDRQAAWPYPGRKRMFFCAERDVHGGSLRAFMLSELPAGVRRAAAGLKGKPMPVGLVRRDIIKGEVLELHRR